MVAFFACLYGNICWYRLLRSLRHGLNAIRVVLALAKVSIKNGTSTTPTIGSRVALFSWNALSGLHFGDRIGYQSAAAHNLSPVSQNLVPQGPILLRVVEIQPTFAVRV